MSIIYFLFLFFFFFNDTPTPEIYTLSLHDALPIWLALDLFARFGRAFQCFGSNRVAACSARRIIPRLIVGLVRIVVSAAIVVPPAAIAAAPTRAMLLRRSSRSGSFQRRLFFVFFVHKLQRPIARRGKRTT